MSVPKGRRKDDKKLHVMIEMQKLRKMVSKLLVSEFGFNEEKYEARIEELKNKGYKNVDLMIKKYDAFISWYTIDERKAILDLIRDAEKELVMGNRIYIYTLVDYDERRYHLNECMGYLHALNNELQAVIDYLPVDINKYTQFGTKIDEIVSMLSGMRKNDNEVRRNIIAKKRGKKPDENDYDSHMIPCVNKSKESICK